MKKFFLFLAICFSLPTVAQEIKPDESLYGTAFWEADTLGNHRAIVRLDSPTETAKIYLPWRRRDKDPEQKGLIIVDAQTGKQIVNFYRKEVNREFGILFFQPQTVPGNYYIYYLPYHSSGGPYPKVF